MADCQYDDGAAWELLGRAPRSEVKKEAKAKTQAKAKAKATTKAAPKPTTKPAEQYHTSPCTMRQRVSDIICKDSFEINFGDILCHA